MLRHQLQKPIRKPAAWHHGARLQLQQYSGNIGGPINKKASFFFNVERRNIGALNVVSATVLDPANNFAIVPESLAVANPQTRTNLSPRIDYQLTPNNTLTVRYSIFATS